MCASMCQSMKKYAEKYADKYADKYVEKIIIMKTMGSIQPELLLWSPWFGIYASASSTGATEATPHTDTTLIIF